MPERSTGPMMFIGERCAFDECHREDFLPFKCVDCRLHFCSNHFRPQTHRCPTYEAGNKDYRVPLCPICDNPPAGWKRDEDPNIAMDRHLSGQCPMLDQNGIVKLENGKVQAKTRPKKTNECTYIKCSKIMVVPIQCPQCSASFCPSHRAPTQHACAASAKPAPSVKSTTGASSSSSGSAFKGAFKNLTSSATSSAGVQSSSAAATSSSSAERRRNSAASNARVDQTTGGSSASSSKPFSKMFDKTEKRAKAERMSAIRAMQARQRKGILSEADELKLAQEMAAMAKIGNKKADSSDCVIS